MGSMRAQLSCWPGAETLPKVSQSVLPMRAASLLMNHAWRFPVSCGEPDSAPQKLCGKRIRMDGFFGRHERDSHWEGDPHEDEDEDDGLEDDGEVGPALGGDILGKDWSDGERGAVQDESGAAYRCTDRRGERAPPWSFPSPCPQQHRLSGPRSLRHDLPLPVRHGAVPSLGTLGMPAAEAAVARLRRDPAWPFGCGLGGWDALLVRDGSAAAGGRRGTAGAHRPRPGGSASSGACPPCSRKPPCISPLGVPSLSTLPSTASSAPSASC